jgi:hypothetical protein
MNQEYYIIGEGDTKMKEETIPCIENEFVELNLTIKTKIGIKHTDFSCLLHDFSAGKTRLLEQVQEIVKAKRRN